MKIILLLLGLLSLQGTYAQSTEEEVKLPEPPKYQVATFVARPELPQNIKNHFAVLEKAKASDAQVGEALAILQNGLKTGNPQFSKEQEDLIFDVNMKYDEKPVGKAILELEEYIAQGSIAKQTQLFANYTAVLQKNANALADYEKEYAKSLELKAEIAKIKSDRDQIKSDRDQIKSDRDQIKSDRDQIKSDIVKLNKMAANRTLFNACVKAYANGKDLTSAQVEAFKVYIDLAIELGFNVDPGLLKLREELENK